MRNSNLCRLKPSNIEGAGVGVFAIGKIVAGINPFPDCDTNLRTMSCEEFMGLTPEFQKMVRDFCYYSSGNWRVPVDFNKLDISWYVNSSSEPNLEFNTVTSQYRTLREIVVGE